MGGEEEREGKEDRVLRRRIRERKRKRARGKKGEIEKGETG